MDCLTNTPFLTKDGFFIADSEAEEDFMPIHISNVELNLGGASWRA